MGQPLGGFDVLAIDLGQFNRLSGCFRVVRGGPFENDDVVIVDERSWRPGPADVPGMVAMTMRKPGMAPSHRKTASSGSLTH